MFIVYYQDLSGEAQYKILCAFSEEEAASVAMGLGDCAAVLSVHRL